MSEDALPQPYRLLPASDPSPILLSVPHSGRHYPPALLAQSNLPISTLQRLEDPLVDHIAEVAGAAGADVIAALPARAWIDLNRSETDLDPTMFAPRPADYDHPASPRIAAGLGLFPKRLGDGQPIYRERLPLSEKEERLNAAHRPFHQKISALLDNARRLHETALLIDCHSMPPLPRRGREPSWDVVIGDRFGTSAAPWLIDAFETAFRRAGYRVRRNAPYAGGYIVTHHGRPASGIHALQVEFDRQLYLDLERLELLPGWRKLAEDFASVISSLRNLLWGAQGSIAAE